MSIPTEIKLRRRSKLLVVVFDERLSFELPFEYLRVFSPSAEVRGHGGGEMQLVAGKRTVSIEAVEPVGNYAVRLRFDDGHDSGLYTWDLLRELGENQAQNWAYYLRRLEQAGASRDG